jgi:hypothetical protein
MWGRAGAIDRNSICVAPHLKIEVPRKKKMRQNGGFFLAHISAHISRPPSWGVAGRSRDPFGRVLSTVRARTLARSHTSPATTRPPLAAALARSWALHVSLSRYCVDACVSLQPPVVRATAAPAPGSTAPCTRDSFHPRSVDFAWRCASCVGAGRRWRATAAADSRARGP